MMARSEESHSGSESDDILNQQVGIEESLHDLSSAGMVPHPEESKALSSIMTTSQPSVTNILGKRERDGPAAITIDDIYQPKKKIHRKQAWSREEDSVLLACIETYGAANWDVLSKHLDGRSGKQCRERYFNILDPNVKRGHWTIEEDHLIIELHNAIGNKWAEISARLKGRTDNSVKNRWHTLNNSCVLPQKPFDESIPLSPSYATSTEFALEGGQHSQAQSFNTMLNPMNFPTGSGASVSQSQSHPSLPSAIQSFQNQIRQSSILHDLKQSQGAQRNTSSMLQTLHSQLIQPPVPSMSQMPQVQGHQSLPSAIQSFQNQVRQSSILHELQGHRSSVLQTLESHIQQSTSLPNLLGHGARVPNSSASTELTPQQIQNLMQSDMKPL